MMGFSLRCLQVLLEMQGELLFKGQLEFSAAWSMELVNLFLTAITVAIVFTRYFAEHMHKKGVGVASTMEAFSGLEMGVLAPHAEHVRSSLRAAGWLLA
jgi:hypothetical protein